MTTHLHLRLAGLAAAAVVLLAGCGASDTGGGAASSSSAGSSPGAASAAPAACTTPGPGSDDFHRTVQLSTRSDGLQVGDITVGTGPVAMSGQTLTVQYSGWLSDGCSFDSSRKPGGQPFSFPLGQGQVIKGWDEGIPGMRAGGLRRLVIPPALGYGPQGSPPVIPPNATLTFDVQLVSIG